MASVEPSTSVLVPDDVSASFEGTGINSGNTQELVPYYLTVNRAVQVTVAWQEAVKSGWTVRM